MTEIIMRRIGLKLVFGAAVALLLVSSVRQQWNSSKEKFARQETPSSTQSSQNVGEGFEASSDEEANLQTDDTAEGIDASVEDNSLETKSWSENNGTDNSISFKNLSAVSNRQKEEFSEETANPGEDQVSEYATNINMSMGTKDNIDNSQISSPIHFSTHGTFGNQAEIIRQDAEETDAEIPNYDDSSDQDPNWRSSKYADALYADEEGDENNSKNDQLQLNNNDFTENEKVSEKTDEVSAERFVGNANSKDSNILSWLGLGKYLSAEYKREGANNERVLGSSHDSIDSDVSQLNDKDTEMSSLDSESSFLTAKEANGTGTSMNMTYTEIYNVINKYTGDTSNFGTLQVPDKLQSTPTIKQLPFDVNGIGIANYDDFDDLDFGKNPIQTKEFENSNRLEYSDEISQSDTIKGAQDHETGIPDGRNAVSYVEDKQNEIRSDDQVRKTNQMDSPDFHKSDETQNDQQPAQPLLYERPQPPLPPNLLQRQSPPEAHIPPRILDLMLANNVDLAHSQQFLAKLQYYLHQAIHRIDQDVDPDSSSKTGNTVFRQAHLVALPPSKSNILLSQMTAMGEFNNDKIQQGEFNNDQIQQEENVPAQETNNNDIYEDNYDNNGTFYDTIHTNIDVDESSDKGDDMNGQPGIYTSPPEPAVYDNPRPLSESEFALYRTQPYNGDFSLTKSVSDSPVDVKVTENHSNTMLVQQTMNKLGTTNEDESLPCPREPHLAKTTYPITALVSFSDSSTPWVRNILEQLTGIETDSIYNIMGQLKSGNAENVYHMGRTIAIETHMASVKNFDRAVVVIRNPFAVDVQHRIFRPSSIDWQKSVLWNHTYSTWLDSNLPLHVLTFEDLAESPLTELMKLTNFLSAPDVTISYKCAMKLALDPPSIINNVKEITGIYHDDRRRINQNIDYVIQVALKKHPDIVLRLNSYKVLSGT